MSASAPKTWRGVKEEVRRRIRERVWKPGEAIPREADLAQEFGCARATVNRALQELADTGILERKRRSGTRVALHPPGRAIIEIPLIRKEIEALGLRYGYALLVRRRAAPPHAVAIAMSGASGAEMLHVRALHSADGRPRVLEDRWINLATVPQAAVANFTARSPNEWLLENVPFSRGELSISARACGAAEADALTVAEGAPLLVLDRTTWSLASSITHVRLWYEPGHRIVSSIRG